MPLEIKATEVQPKQEGMTFEIEVFVNYNDSGIPFVSAHVVGNGNPYIPTIGKLTERYTFKIVSPFINKEQS